MKFLRLIGVLVLCVIAITGQAVADGDPAKGEKLFKGFLNCSNCHSLDAGETKVGPTLAGLFGRKAGSVEGFNQYSEAMVNSGVVWDEETLNAFLKNPKDFIPGNSMMMEGYYIRPVSSDQHRADVITYLKEVTAQ
jgi:cytochrome c